MNQKVEKVKQSLVTVIMLVAVAGFTSCEKVGILPIPFDPAATLSFKSDIQPIFSANCISCHGPARSPDLRDGKSYNALKNGGYVNAPAETSRLNLKITSSDHFPRTTDTEKLKVLNWIKQGAQNN